MLKVPLNTNQRTIIPRLSGGSCVKNRKVHRVTRCTPVRRRRRRLLVITRRFGTKLDCRTLCNNRQHLCRLPAAKVVICVCDIIRYLHNSSPAHLLAALAVYSAVGSVTKARVRSRWRTRYWHTLSLRWILWRRAGLYDLESDTHLQKRIYSPLLPDFGRGLVSELRGSISSQLPVVIIM